MGGVCFQDTVDYHFDSCKPFKKKKILTLCVYTVHFLREFVVELLAMAHTYTTYCNLKKITNSF